MENGTDIITANESLNIIGKDGTTVTYDKNSNTYTVSSKNGGTGTGSMSDWNVTGSDGKGGSVKRAHYRWQERRFCSRQQKCR